MKFVLHHNESFPPHYDLILDTGGTVEIFRIPEDFFFDLVSGSPVEYETVTGADKNSGPVNCGEGKVSVEDSGEYSIEKPGTMILKGVKISGKLIADSGSRHITLIPG
ncbi:MAG TPA: hypothetical protein PK514_06535 [Spirochaetota bacterium]|nr:hypothetical protein [Spirochaetota bacterium]